MPDAVLMQGEAQTGRKVQEMSMGMVSYCLHQGQRIGKDSTLESKIGGFFEGQKSGDLISNFAPLFGLVWPLHLSLKLQA